MRARVAKSLRRFTKKLAEEKGITEVCSYTEDSKKRKREFIRDNEGNIILDEKQVPATREISTGQMTCDMNSIRGIYLLVKKNHRTVRLANH